MMMDDFETLGGVRKSTFKKVFQLGTKEPLQNRHQAGIEEVKLRVRLNVR